MISATTLKNEIKQLIETCSPPGLVLAVYLFGSALRSEFKDRSDIDLSFLVDENRYREDPFEATAPVHMIAGKIGVIFDRETDVVILNSASLEIAHEIIATGLILFEKETDLRLEYEIKIKGMYFDFQPFLAELRARKIAKLRSVEASG